mmetsp:Transcript_8963/g.12337  ORF Transcript_8963/g.12337 Transcript_8963/m.12337 type:complete len:288 (+) Transcript_8963:50-913(+)
MEQQAEQPNPTQSTENEVELSKDNNNNHAHHDTAYDAKVTLNVGGKRYETYITTLQKYPDSLLGTMFSDRNKNMLRPNPKGEYFFDRNGEVFSVILDFYRTDKLCVPPSVNDDLLQDELEYFQLPVSTKDSMRLGSYFRRLSIKSALQIHSEFLKLTLEGLIKIVEKAAQEGCRFCEIDILKGNSWKRTSDGKLDQYRYFRNYVDPKLVEFLSNQHNRWLFEYKLKEQKFAFVLFPTQGQKNWGLTFHLWEDIGGSDRASIASDTMTPDMDFYNRAEGTAKDPSMYM